MEAPVQHDASARTRSRKADWIVAWGLSGLAAAAMLHYFRSYRPTFVLHVAKLLPAWNAEEIDRLAIAFDTCTLIATLVSFAAFFRYLRPRDTVPVRSDARDDIKP